MADNTKYVISGVIILLLIPVATMSIQRVGSPVVQENTTVASEDNDQFLWENSNDTSQTTWSEEQPYDGWELAKRDEAHRPLPAWLHSLLLILVPLSMGASAIYSFTRIGT